MNEALKKIGVLLLGAAVALAAAEGIVRFFPQYRLDALGWFGTESSVHWAPCRNSDDLGYELVPSAKDGVNSFGMRDKEYSRRKPAGACRILLLGDSITETGRWSDYTEEMFNRDPGRPFEILNAGVRGWGLYNYYAYLRLRGQEFDPDAVLVGFCLNDMRDVDTVRMFAGGGPKECLVFYVKAADARTQAFRTLCSSRINRWLFLKSSLYRLFVVHFVLADTARSARDEDTVRDMAARELAEMKQRAHGRLYGIVFPYLKPLAAYTSREKAEYRMTLSALKEAGIDYLDLTSNFNAYGEKITTFREHPGDQIHFNDAANRLKAGLIYPWLKERIPARGRKGP